MHVGRLLARLNPKNVRFDVGSGGIPELTTQDIAGAIAFVPAGLGRELMCHVWWPDGAALTAKAFDDTLTKVQLNEWSRREEAMYKALVRAVCAGSELATRGDRSSAAAAYDRAHRRRWPGVMKSESSKDKVDPMVRYAGVRRGVLQELAQPRKCTKCGGKGEVRSLGAIRACANCNGQGDIAYTKAARAFAVGVKPSSYEERWAAPYEWLLDHLTTELQEAERAFRRAMGSHEKAA